MGVEPARTARCAAAFVSVRLGDAGTDERTGMLLSAEFTKMRALGPYAHAALAR